MLKNEFSVSFMWIAGSAILNWIGALLFAIPTYIIGIHQTQIASEMGYFYARVREAVEPMKTWMWLRLIPDSLMIIGGGIILFDLVNKTFFAKKIAEVQQD